MSPPVSETPAPGVERDAVFQAAEDLLYAVDVTAAGSSLPGQIAAPVEHPAEHLAAVWADQSDDGPLTGLAAAMTAVLDAVRPHKALWPDTLATACTAADAALASTRHNAPAKSGTSRMATANGHATNGYHRPPPTRPQDQEDGPARRVRLTPASSVRMRPVRWLWTDRIPAGAITLIPGREGIGKSLTLAWLAARLTRGQLPGILHGQPRPVIYAATEDSWAHTIAPRLFAAGADLDMVYRVDVEHDGTLDQLTLPLDCARLAEEITRLGVALLAADPLMSLISSRVDTFKDQQLRTALEPLARLADQTGCAVVGLAHFNKSATTDALNLITGSRAFSAVARAVLAIARDPVAEDGSCVLSQAKNNLGRLDLPSLRYVINTAEVPTDEGPAYVGVLTFTGESDRSVADILTETTTDPHEHSERSEAAEWLTDYLSSKGGSAPREDIVKAARAAGVAEATLKRARHTAKVTSATSGFPRRAVWSLPDPHAPSHLSPVGSQSAQSDHSPKAEPTEPTEPTETPLAPGAHSPSRATAQQTLISDQGEGIAS